MKLCWTLFSTFLVIFVKLSECLNSEFYSFYPASMEMDGAKNIYDKCISANRKADLSTIYTKNIRIKRLTEPTKGYIECILNSNNFVKIKIIAHNHYQFERNIQMLFIQIPDQQCYAVDGFSEAAR